MKINKMFQVNIKKFLMKKSLLGHFLAFTRGLSVYFMDVGEQLMPSVIDNGVWKVQNSDDLTSVTVFWLVRFEAFF